MGKNFRWKTKPSKAWKIPLVVARWENAIRAELWYWAPQIEAAMKRDASWIDRTSNARQGLQADVQQIRPGVLALIARHTMDYGVWLELCNAGKYAIVLPTLENYYAQIWQGIKGRIQ